MKKLENKTITLIKSFKSKRAKRDYEDIIEAEKLMAAKALYLKSLKSKKK